MADIVTNFIIRTFKRFYLFILFFLSVIIFFLSYNTYLIDRSLENLKFSLDTMAQADDLISGKDVGMLLDYSLIKEVSSNKLTLDDLAKFEYIDSVLRQGGFARRVEDIRFILKEAVEKKIKDRALLGHADRANEVALSALNKLTGKRRHPAPVKVKSKIDEIKLEAARNAENNWDFARAAKLYEELARDYPAYEGRGLLKLRGAYCYDRLHQYKKAELIYKEVYAQTKIDLERELAKRLITALGDTYNLMKKKSKLAILIKELKTKEELQEGYLRLGLMNLELFDFKEAIASLSDAVSQDPGSPTAFRAKFMMAWAYKFKSELERSRVTFEELSGNKDAGSSFMFSKYELADLYRRQGDYEEAVARYDDLVEGYDKEPFAPLVQFQLGCTYLYDLNDIESAAAAFNKLKEKYPDSSYVLDGLNYLKEFEARAGDLNRIASMYLLTYLEKVLPSMSADIVKKITSIGSSLGSPGSQVEGEYDNRRLSNFIADKFSDIMPEVLSDLAIEIHKDSIDMTALFKMRELSHNVRFSFALKNDANRLALSIRSVSVEDATIPLAVAKETIAIANTALHDASFPLVLDELTLEEGRLSFRGKVQK